jgi:hypothetical protein
MIEVRNTGPHAVADAIVANATPAVLTLVTWTCAASPGASCGSPSGQGDVSTTITLPPGGLATLEVTGALSASASGMMTNTATVTAPAGVLDVDPDNNIAADTDRVTQSSCTCWVAPAPTGSDENPGTESQPWATLDHAAAAVLLGGATNCTVLFTDGVYAGSNDVHERFTTVTTFRALNRYRATLENAGPVLLLSGARNLVIEGFELRHSGDAAAAAVVEALSAGDSWTEDLVIRDNVLHDSLGGDLLRIHSGVRFATVEGNVFYNQASGNEHVDVDGATDVFIQDNAFFNDFVGSGRVNANDTLGYIAIKDSNGDGDGQIGSARITARRNVFLNWEGSAAAGFVTVGAGPGEHYQASDVVLENNLMLGNSPSDMAAPLVVKASRNLTFRNNTVAGDLPSLAYAFSLGREGLNPSNENIAFYNNVWADPAGSMGAPSAGGAAAFSHGAAADTAGLVLDANLYWNAGLAVPAGEQVDPAVADALSITDDPGISSDQAGVVLPRWNGTSFASGRLKIRREVRRLVRRFGSIPTASPACNSGLEANSADDDILGQVRSTPDRGAYEASPVVGRRDSR